MKRVLIIAVAALLLVNHAYAANRPDASSEHLSAEQRAQIERQERLRAAQERLREAERAARGDVVDDQQVEGPSYALIPLEGQIGVHVRWAELSRALALAERAGADAVILKITSGGGEVGAMREICQGLLEWNRAHPEVDLVAFVEEAALSAAAVIAMSCPEIYMAPGSIIGSTARISVTRAGEYQPILKEKMLSPMRAHDRAVATAAGHDGRIALAMLDADVSLWMVPTEGPDKVRLVPSAPDDRDGVEELVQRGELLTLTDEEAATIGLAEATVDGPERIGRERSTPEWQEVGGAGRRIMERHATGVDRAFKDFNRRVGLINEALTQKIEGSARELARIKQQQERGKRHVARLTRLAEHHDWVDPVARHEFDRAVANLAAVLDQRIGQAERALENAAPRRTRRQVDFGR